MEEVVPVVERVVDILPFLEEVWVAYLDAVFYAAPVFSSFDMYRPVVERNDYTYGHLPVPPLWLRRPEARFASFAARIARSSLWIRSRLR